MLCTISEFNIQMWINTFSPLFISLKISQESCLLTGLGIIFNDRYLVLRENSKVFITKKNQIFWKSGSWKSDIFILKRATKNGLPFYNIFFIFFTKLLTKSVLKKEKNCFLQNCPVKPTWLYFTHSIYEEK